MLWKIDKRRPIGQQIEEIFCIKIASGELKPGEKIMSVRDVALAASVNPNTVQKAFESLEMMGLLTSVRGSGWFVCENTERSKEMFDTLIKSKTDEYLSFMKSLGLDLDRIINLIKGECEDE